MAGNPFRDAIDRTKSAIKELTREELEGALLCYMIASVDERVSRHLTKEEDVLAGLAVAKVRARNSQLLREGREKK